MQCGHAYGYQCFGGTYPQVKTEVVSSSEMLVSTYQTTWHHNPQDHYRYYNFSSLIQDNLDFTYVSVNAYWDRKLLTDIGI